MIPKISIRSTIFSLLMICFALCLQTACTASPPVESELQRLQGQWISDDERKTEITITGDSLYFYERPDFWYTATITLPADSTPQQMHATITGSAPPVKDLGQTVAAIYKFEGGIFVLATEGGSNPPATFEEVMSPYILRKVRP